MIEPSVNNTAALLCDKNNCKDLIHCSKLDHLYAYAMDKLVFAESQVCRKSSSVKKHAIKGWNAKVKSLHVKYRAFYINWVNTGKSKNSNSYVLMSKSRSAFKKALKACKKENELFDLESIVTDYGHKDFQQFWKKVKQYDQDNSVLSEQIDNVQGRTDCANLWRDVYKNLFSLDGDKDCADKQVLLNRLDKLDSCAPKFSLDQILTAISKLGSKKARGPERICAENFKYCDISFAHFFVNLINAFVSHAYLPQNLMSVHISPIVKKKGVDISCSNNYRPIALATSSSKFFEHAMLDRFEFELSTGYYQYGYKKKHGTGLAVFSLKQTIFFYNNKGSSVFASFLDASKACDNVLHAKLCNKLLDRGLDCQIVRCFFIWWKHQSFPVK